MDSSFQNPVAQMLLKPDDALQAKCFCCLQQQRLPSFSIDHPLPNQGQRIQNLIITFFTFSSISSSTSVAMPFMNQITRQRVLHNDKCFDNREENHHHHHNQPQCKARCTETARQKNDGFRVDDNKGERGWFLSCLSEAIGVKTPTSSNFSCCSPPLCFEHLACQSRFSLSWSHSSSSLRENNKEPCPGAVTKREKSGDKQTTQCE